MKPTSSGPSQRQLRAGELIRHALADVFTRGDVGDPELDRFGVTVQEVQMSPDLKIATAYVRPLLVADGETMLAVLRRNQKHIRGVLTPKLAMKFMPEVRFRIDTALDYAGRIDEILKSPAVARDLKREEGGTD